MIKSTIKQKFRSKPYMDDTADYATMNIVHTMCVLSIMTITHIGTEKYPKSQ